MGGVHSNVNQKRNKEKSVVNDHSPFELDDCVFFFRVC